MAITKATASSIAPAAKGDIVIGSATNDAGVLGVGTNGYTIVADSAQTLGVKWAAASAGKFAQVLSSEGTTTVSTSGATDITTLSVACSATNSKVLLLGVATLSPTQNANGYSALWFRNTTDNTNIASNYGAGVGASTPFVLDTITALAVYSPNSTSSKTYGLRFGPASGGTTSVSTGGYYWCLIAMEVLA